MPDKRAYTRTRVILDAVLYDRAENHEIVCDLENISERGICFKVPKTEVNLRLLQVGESATFHFIDPLVAEKFPEDTLVTGSFVIRHIDEFDDHILVGGYIGKKEFEHYVSCRRTVAAIKSLPGVSIP